MGHKFGLSCGEEKDGAAIEDKIRDDVQKAAEITGAAFDIIVLNNDHLAGSGAV